MPLVSGTRLGTYEIVAPLGAGGMGEVYRAKDLRLGREVALKVLLTEAASVAERLALFEREARTVAGINHPNIVTLYSVEDEDGLRFLTMELVEGQSLDELVVPGGLPFPRLLDLAIPLADALVAAHEKGVIHRDLKPGNVMVSREGRLKVLDFGLAKLTDAPADPVLTRAATEATPISVQGRVVGTVPYMAPEQLRGETLDQRSDLFSFGIILYELATGRRPFVGTSAAEIVSGILRDSPEPLTRVRGDLPGDLEEIVRRCLEKLPRDRVQSALEVSTALRRMRRALDRGEPLAAGRLPREPIASIAVLPFVNRSSSADDEYFSDGLADELLAMLAKIKGLRVSARASSFHFKGKDATLAEIGKVLNVATVLDGSVRKVGNRVRINVQLVKVSDGYHLWSESYDRTLEDIFAVQDDIAQSVVKELRSALLGEAADSDASGEAKADVARAARGRGSDPEAHRLYLLARHLIGRYTHDDLAKGIVYMRQAVERDPDFARAWAELSRAYAREADQGWAPADEGYSRARAAAERALALEPDLPEGHARLAWIRMTHDWDWRGAEASCARALELAPGDIQTVGQAGVLASTLGRFDQAIALYRRSLEHAPLSSPLYHNLGLALLAADRLEEAEEACRKALELAPQRFGTHAYLAQVELARGQLEEALAEAGREPSEPYRLLATSVVHHALGQRGESDAAIETLIEKYADTMAYQIAETHAARGEADAAFAWLERAYAQRDGGLADMRRSTLLRGLHGDPRWGAFLERVGFET